MLKRLSHLLGFYATLAWRSVSDTGVYLRAALLPGKLLITYTLFASLFIATGHMVRFRVQDVPVIEKQAAAIWQELADNWPTDLELRYAENRWSIAPEQTVTVEYPQGGQRPEGWPSSLATLSPVDPTELSPLPPSLIIAGPTTFYVRSAEDSTAQGIAWAEVLPADQEILLTKQVVQDMTPTVAEWTRIGSHQAGYFLLLWWFLGVWLLRLLGLIIYAWLAQALWTLRGRQLRFATVYKMGLLILPVAELMLLIWHSFWPNLNAPLSFWWIWLLIMAVIVLTAPRKA